MAEATCPPPERFEIVYPGDVVSAAQKFDSEVRAFSSDVFRETGKRSKSGELPEAWSSYAASWNEWAKGWSSWYSGHDEWTENVFNAAGKLRQLDEFKCQLIDFQNRIRELGGTTSAPKPKFAQGSDTIGDLTKLLLVAGGLYLAVTFVRSR